MGSQSISHTSWSANKKLMFILSNRSLRFSMKIDCKPKESIDLSLMVILANSRATCACLVSMSFTIGMRKIDNCSPSWRSTIGPCSRAIAGCSCTSVLFTCTSLAYGPTGHEIVGGIADKLLANTPTAARVNALIDGMTLEKAAVIPDEIKSWDKHGADDPSGFPHYSDHPKIDNQLRDFWRANQPTHDLNSAVPSHHWFHYTDVPVLNAAKYSDGKTGRSIWDIVHMINYCIAVLQGETLDNNPRKITKPA